MGEPYDAAGSLPKTWSISDRPTRRPGAS